MDNPDLQTHPEVRADTLQHLKEIPLPQNWDTVSLGDVIEQTRERAKDRSFEVMSCSKLHGVILQSEKFKQRVASKDTANYRILQPDAFVYDPMLLWDGSIGRNTYRFPGVVSPAYYVFRATSRVDTSYLAYLLRSPAMIPQYLRISEGTNVRRRKARFDNFAQIPVPLPPLSEQRAIAHILRTVQEAIEKTEQVIEATRELQRSLMAHLFTYGPVPVHEAEQVPLKETESGPMPEHWEALQIGTLSHIQSGGTPSRRASGYYGGPIKWVKTLDLNEGLVANTQETITDTGLQSIRGKIRPTGTVMIAMYGGAGTIGKSGILGVPAATNQAICCIEPNPPRFSSKFLLHYFIHIRPTWMQYAIGTRKDPNISKGVIQRKSIPLPPLGEQEEITSMLEAVDTKVAAEQSRKVALDVSFKTLLHNLMIGKVRVNDLDISPMRQMV